MLQPGRLWPAVISLGLSGFMASFSTVSIAVALPVIALELGLTVARVQWVVTAYFLASVALLLTCGSLADRFGRRRFFLVGLVVSTIGALLGGMAGSLGWLVAARVLQGAGAALVQSTNFAILMTMVPAASRGRFVGLTTTLILMGSLSGPAVAGLLVAWAGWPWVLWAVAPVTSVALVLGWLTIAPDPPARGGGGGFDLPGAVLYVLAMTAVLWGLSGSGPGGVALGLVGGGALLAAFVAVELRSPVPLMRLRLLRRRGFALGVLGHGLYYVALSAMQFVVPFLLIQVRGRSSFETGLVMMALSVGAAVGASTGGWLTDRLGATAMASGGLGLAATGSLWLLRLAAGGGTVEAAAALTLFGLGAGVFIVANRVVVNNSLSAADLGVGNALHTTGRHLGLMVGVPLTVLLVSDAGGALQPMPGLVFSLAVLLAAVPVTVLARAGAGERRG